MKIAVAEVVLPIIRIGNSRGKGILVLVNPRKKPIRMDRMSGFLEKLRSTGFNPSASFAVLSLWSSRIIMQIATLTGAMEATARRASRSPWAVGKLKEINGTPKKATLPKTELRIQR